MPANPDHEYLMQEFHMSRITMSLAALLALLCASSPALAHPGHARGRQESAAANQDRTWTDVSGTLPLRGSFVAAKDGQVQIRRPDDSLVSLKLSQLVEADQTWVEQRLSQIERANELLGRLAKSAPHRTTQTADGEDDPAMNLLVANELPLLLAQADQANAGRNARSPTWPRLLRRL